MRSDRLLLCGVVKAKWTVRTREQGPAVHDSETGLKKEVMLVCF